MRGNQQVARRELLQPQLRKEMSPLLRVEGHSRARASRVRALAAPHKLPLPSPRPPLLVLLNPPHPTPDGRSCGNDFVCSLQCILYRFSKHPCNPICQYTHPPTPSATPPHRHRLPPTLPALPSPSLPASCPACPRAPS